MKIIKISIILSIILLSCKINDKSKGLTSTKEKISKSDNVLILKENAFGNLKLEKGMSLTKLMLKNTFNNHTISLNIGEQDGPNYYFYKIGNKAILTTQNTESKSLYQLWINDKSNAIDEYGIKLGMTYKNIKNKRSDMSVTTEHSHIYLHKDNSNIVYEMSIGNNYNGPDKNEYSLNFLEEYNCKVTSIIWK